MGTRRYRNGFVGQFFDESYSSDLPERWDYYETLDDAMASLLNRYEGSDTFLTCRISNRGMVTYIREESCRFPAVTERAEIALYRVDNGKVRFGEFPYRLVKLDENGDPYVEEC